MGPPLILCIDDRPEQLGLRRAALEFSGFCVVTANDGWAAIQVLHRRSVDAVVLEYKEEGMDAEALAYQINQKFPSVPIILLSAYFEMREQILWLVDEYVMKSELPGGLIHVLKRVTRPVDTDEAFTLATSTAEPRPDQIMSHRITVCSICDKRVSPQEDACDDENGGIVHTDCQVKQTLAS
jgi:CheY-like chemotaxis protein